MVPGSPGLVDAPPYPRHPLREFTPARRGGLFARRSNSFRHRLEAPFLQCGVHRHGAGSPHHRSRGFNGQESRFDLCLVQKGMKTVAAPPFCPVGARRHSFFRNFSIVSSASTVAAVSPVWYTSLTVGESRMEYPHGHVYFGKFRDRHPQ